MSMRRVLTHSHWGAFVAEVDDGRLVGVRPFEKDPYPSDLINAWPEMVYSKTRIARPMVREGYLRGGPGSDMAARGRESFVPVSWDKALDLVAREVDRVRTTFGNQAIFGGSYGWASAGRFHHARTQLHRFYYRAGGCVGQLTNYSWGTAAILLPHIMGDNSGVTGRATSWSSIIKHTRLMVAFGGLNPKNWQVTSGGAGQHAMEHWVRAAASAGVRFVVIGPTRDDAPDFLNAEWIAPRPNTDTAIMLAMAHTIIAAGLHDAGFLSRCCSGYERLRGYLMGETDGEPKTAEWAGAIAGIDAQTIRALAHDMAANRTMLTAAWSLQRADHGEQPFWALIALASVLGQIGLPGGGFAFGYGSTGGPGTPNQALPVPSLNTGPNPINTFIPVARIADMLLDPGGAYQFNGRNFTYPDIKLIHWAGGNPFHHHQDLNRLIEAWRKPDTVIVNESWWTPTARHADIVLPASTTLERNDIGAPARAHDRFLIAMPKAIEPVGEARADFDIFADVADRLGFRDSYTEGRGEMAWLRHLWGRARQQVLETNNPMPKFDDFWARGYWEVQAPLEEYVTLADFRGDPEGHPLGTPSGRVELYSETIAGFGYDDCPAHPTWLEPREWLGSTMAAKYPLHLISSQPKGKLHGQMDPSGPSQRHKVGGREKLTINPVDATARYISDGDVVRVFNSRGACLAGVAVSEDVRRGVVVLATGSWYDPEQLGTPGSLDKHGNANVLTYDAGTSRLGQGPSAMTALVEVELVTDAPPVTAFDPPAEVGG